MTTEIPNPTTFTTAPLRHRLRVELNASAPDVWALVGTHTRLPEYSAGIASVEVEGSGASRARVCHFRSPDGKGVLAIQRGIEVGHVFYLGTKYSAAMNATYLDENGKPQLMEMGCYGIGVTRILGAAIEQNHDERGIVWPASIAPFTVVICPIGMDRNEDVKAAATKLYDELLDLGIDVLLDDRGERPGAMFADWELVGVPHRVVISDRGLKEGQVEVQGRRDAAATKLALAEVVAHLKQRLA